MFSKSKIKDYMQYDLSFSRKREKIIIEGNKENTNIVYHWV